ncbi:MAG: hypothetical protein BA863_07710 [Desulfovibrio sp. S3730MH75]|nr:MAG: hypothetical protein BA863_07710 [Desulfovibrio sp. S3730MH75]
MNIDRGTGFLKTAKTNSDKKNEDLTEVLSEIQEMIGLDSVKEELNKLIAFARVVKLKRDRGLPVGSISLHMVFTGPPGTGKTEIARKVGRVLKGIGMLSRGHCVEVDKAALTSVYANSGPQLITDKVKEALNGVLFIDEAYTLAGKDVLSGPDHSGGEVIDTLLKLMEDNRERLVVIVAGYTAEMRRFIESNVGLKSRFTRLIEFKSYTAEELFEIFQLMAAKEQYIFTSDAEEEVRRYFQDIRGSSTKSEPDFGNARTARVFLEKILPAQAERISGIDGYENLSDEELLTITVDDVLHIIESE